MQFSLLVLISCWVTVLGSPTSEIGVKEVPEDARLTVPQLIQKYGYPAEIHQVQTEDGYILEMHRIPYGVAPGAGPNPDKPVVLLQHGLTSSSADYLLAGPQKSLGYLLADLGYDVWMGNARGNKYSRNHIKLKPNKGKFWEFSWHEIGVYDLPAMIDYILYNTNKENLFYIGHSQGTTAFYVMCSEKPEYNGKIRAMFSLAPVAYMGHIVSPLPKFLSKFEGSIEILTKLVGLHEWMPSREFLAKFGGVFCKEGSPTQFICSNTLFIICGFNPEQMTADLLPVIMGHTPAGSSTRQHLHYAQNIKAVNKFRQYDFGILKNLIKYKSIKPPKYDISKITAPVALMYSHNDWLAAEVDVLKLYYELPNTIGRFLVPDEKFNHIDFLYAKDVVTLLYNRLFSLMNRF